MAYSLWYKLYASLMLVFVFDLYAGLYAVSFMLDVML